MITRRAAAPVSCGCARRPAVIPSRMKERALRKMSLRAFMVRLLGKTGSSDDCPSPGPDCPPAGFRWRNHQFTRVPAGYECACRGVQYIIELFLMHFGDK